MDGKWWLWYLLIFFFAAPAFSQDTIYLDKKGRWLDSKENAFRYCTRVDLAEDNIEVKVYNLGDTLLYLHHFSYFVDDPKKCIVNGVSSIFYADGQLSDTYMNVKGKKEGEYRRFYRNGELKYLCHFENNSAKDSWRCIIPMVLYGGLKSSEKDVHKEVMCTMLQEMKLSSIRLSGL